MTVATHIKKRFLAGGVKAVIALFVSLVTNVGINILLPRLLKPNDVGLFFLTASIVNFGVVFSTFGLNQSVVRFVAESISLKQFRRAIQVIRLTFLLAMLTTLTVNIVYFCTANIIAVNIFHAAKLSLFTGLIIGWILVSTFEKLLGETFRGFHSIALASIFSGSSGSGGSGLIFFIFLCLLLGTNNISLFTIVVFAIVSSFVILVLGGFFLIKKVKSLTRLNSDSLASSFQVSKLFQVTVPLFVMNITQFIATQGDIWILSIFQSQEEVAIYALVSKLVLIVAIPLITINAVLPPLVVELYSQGQQKALEQVLRNVATLAAIPAFLLLLVFTTFSSSLLNTFYGSYYSSGSTLLVVLCFGWIFNVFSGSCGVVLVMTGHQHISMKTTAFSALLLLCGGLWAAKYYGSVGMASVVTVVMILQNAINFYFVKKKVGVWTHASFSLKQVKEMLSF